MSERILKVYKIKIFINKIIKLAMYEEKLAYIGFENDNIHDFYKGYKVRNVLNEVGFEKYIEMIRKFENNQEIKIDFNDFYLKNLTEKQIEVLKEVGKLEYGQYMTYSDFAKLINKADHTGFIATCRAKSNIIVNSLS